VHACVRRGLKLRVGVYVHVPTNESASVAGSNILYGCESWTLRKNEETRVDAFEMKGFREQQRKQTSGFLTKLE